MFLVFRLLKWVLCIISKSPEAISAAIAKNLVSSVNDERLCCYNDEAHPNIVVLQYQCQATLDVCSVYFAWGRANAPGSSNMMG